MKFLRKLKKSIKKRYKKIRCYLQNGKKILVLSDSHGGVFEYIFENDLFVPHYINVDMVGGATAWGLNKENSTTESFEKYKRIMKICKDFDIVIIQLGEVDSAFIWWKKMEAGLSKEEVLEHSIKGIKKLIEYIQNNHRFKIILAGTVLPTLKEGQMSKGKDVELRKKVNIPQIEKTKIILEYNEKMKKLANEYNLDYIDITEETLNPNTGVIDDRFIRHDIVDHHHNFSVTADLWIKKLDIIK